MKISGLCLRVGFGLFVVSQSAFAEPTGATFTPPDDYVDGEAVNTNYESAPTSLQAIDQKVYRGSYTCLQGPTHVEIDLTGIGYGLDGVFRFGGGRVPQGSYTFELRPMGGNRFQLLPLRWKQQPRGFHMVGAEITVANGQLSGYITDRDCGSITARATVIASAAPAAPARISQPVASAAPSAPVRVTTADTGTTLDQLLDRIVHADSRSWRFNTYVVGSMTGAKYLSTNKSKTTYVAEGNYKYGSFMSGQSSGWVRVKVVNAGLDCLEFHDQPGVCRSPGASLGNQAIVGAIAGAAAGGGGAGGGDGGRADCNPNDMVLVGNEWQPGPNAC